MSNTYLKSTASALIEKMRDSGVPIAVAMKFHKLMRNEPGSKKSRKAVRVVARNLQHNLVNAI